LELARRRGLLEDAGHGKLKDDLEEIARMLSGLISGLDKRSTWRYALVAHLGLTGFAVRMPGMLG